jgi:hypothetical protein
LRDLKGETNKLPFFIDRFEGPHKSFQSQNEKKKEKKEEISFTFVRSLNWKKYLLRVK